jgi:hypothetical protein
VSFRIDVGTHRFTHGESVAEEPPAEKLTRGIEKLAARGGKGRGG